LGVNQNLSPGDKTIERIDLLPTEKNEVRLKYILFEIELQLFFGKYYFWRNNRRIFGKEEAASRPKGDFNAFEKELARRIQVAGYAWGARCGSLRLSERRTFVF
jgi:hypothetical protein